MIGLVSGAKLYLTIAAVLIIGACVWFIYSEYQGMKETITEQAKAITTYETALADTQETLKIVQQEQARTQKAQNELEMKNSAIQEESATLRKMLSEHRLGFLAAQKPGLIELRVNRGTEKVFNDITAITQETNNDKNTNDNSTSY